MKPYEEVCFPSGILRWIREGDEYVCRLTEDQINEIKEIHEEPWVKTYSGGKPNYTQPIEREPYPENFIDALRFDAAQSEPTIDGWPLYSGLPKPEPEPAAWGVDEGEGRCISLHDLYFVKEDADHMAELKGTHAKVVALYTAPPKKEWVGLTDEEIREGNKDSWVTRQAWESAAWWAEAKLKEKNT